MLMVFCLASCKETPVSGYVVGKAFIPAHNTTRYDVILKKPMVESVPDNGLFGWLIHAVYTVATLRKAHLTD